MKVEYIPAAKVNEQVTWKEIFPGGAVLEGGTADLFSTGDWRTNVPTFAEEKCKHCMLCVPTCPDTAIPVESDKRLNFDFNHCKGCGICYKVCPFGAISFGKEDR